MSKKLSLENLAGRTAVFDQNVLIDPVKIGGLVTDFDFDSRVFETEGKEFPRASNVIAFCENTNFLGIKELFNRQIEILVNLFEEACPNCSDMDVVRDMWGMSRDEIRDKVTFFIQGRCPTCNNTKKHFRKANRLIDYNELVGVAGQRCLDPHTMVRYATGKVAFLKDIQEGDFIQGPVHPVKVLKKVYSEHPGFFRVFVKGRNDPFICSDNHQWKVVIGDSSEVLVTCELKEGMLLADNRGPLPIVRIDRVPNQKCMLVDVEVEDEYFLTADGFLMHNSGKSFMTGIIACYSLHRMLCLPIPPSKYYGQELAWVRMSFVAKSGKQAKKTVWGEFKVKFDNSPWFQNYNSYLETESKKQGRKLYKGMETFIRYNHKLIECSYEVPDGGTLRGQTRFFCAIDELGYFNVNKGSKRANGVEVYRSLNNSLRTLRSAYDDLINEGENDPPHILQANISSPNHETDPIMQLYYKRDKKPRSYMFLRETWMMNPTITLESLKSEMESDPVGFWRDYGARPGIAEDTWLKRQEQLDASKTDSLTFLETKEEIIVESVDMTDYYYIKRIITKCAHDKQIPRIICCDAGELYNSYGIVIAHYNKTREKFIVDGAIEIMPRSIDGQLCSVSFPDAFDLIKALCEKLFITAVVFDRWNSTSTIQRIIKEVKVKAYKYSPTFADFLDFKNAITDRMWEIPKPEVTDLTQELGSEYPIAKLIKQTKLVKEVGKKVAKPDSGEGDDLFRAWALCHIIMNQNKQRFATYLSQNAVFKQKAASRATHSHIKRNAFGNVQVKRSSSVVVRKTRKPRY